MKNMKKNINYKECNGVNVLQQCIDVFELILKRGEQLGDEIREFDEEILKNGNETYYEIEDDIKST